MVLSPFACGRDLDTRTAPDFHQGMEVSARAALHYTPGQLDAALEFLKRTRSELRMLRLARVWSDRFRVFDVNGECFEITGIGYPDADIIPILNAVNTVYNRDTIHEPISEPYKEFKTGRRYPWAQDRVM
jgi:hypothetical protein